MGCHSLFQGIFPTQGSDLVSHIAKLDLLIANDTTLMTESEEELKSLLMKVKEQSEILDKNQHSLN